MKKAFLLFTVLCALQAGAQKNTEAPQKDSLSALLRDTARYRFYIKDTLAGNSFKGLSLRNYVSKEWNLTNTNMAEGPIVTIMPNGDMYYLPKAFCQCDSCVSFQGMKFVKNQFASK